MQSPQTKSTPFQAMLALIRKNIGAFAGAMVSTVMTVLIGYLTPLLLAETIDLKSLTCRFVNGSFGS